jgi:hypothetical protein
VKLNARCQSEIDNVLICGGGSQRKWPNCWSWDDGWLHLSGLLLQQSKYLSLLLELGLETLKLLIARRPW